MTVVAGGEEASEDNGSQRDGERPREGETGGTGVSDPTLSQVQSAFKEFVQHRFALPDQAVDDVGQRRDVPEGQAQRRGSAPASEGPDEPEAVSLAPVNWNLLTAAEAEFHWRDLDTWVSWLRRAYGLGPAVIPPSWHRHEELVWELSALHTAWLAAYDPDADPGAPLAWQRDFADARYRLTDWVARSGTKLSSDRATRVTTWPGEPVEQATPEHQVIDRVADFEEFIADDIAQRRAAEAVARAREARPSSSPNHDENRPETA